MAGLLYNDILLSIVFLAWTIPTCMTVKGELPSGFKYLSVAEYSVMMANTNNINSQRTKGVAECNFDNGLCNFYNEKKGDNFDWVLRRGATPSGNTGPRRDLSGKGYYIYIEASSPRRLGHKAILSSPVLSGMVYCLQFGFHAYGKTIGALAVYKKDFNKTEELFKLEKDHGKKWQYIVGTVVHPNSFQIEFEGAVGKSYTGDIALDNIRITQGRCRIAGNNTEECGFGYPGFSSVFSGLQGYSNWPWLVELSASGKSQPLCSAAHVGNDWLITSKKCVEKFAKMDIIIYQGKSNIGRRKIVKIHEHPSHTSEAVLLQLNKTTSKEVKNKVCLPHASIYTQTLLQKCLLLATSFSGYIRDFVESKVTIISMKKCEPYLQTAPWTHQDKKQLLCIQLDSHYNINRTRLASDGYIVCENKVIHRWILHAVGSIFYPISNTKLLIFTKVSTVVDWMEKLINISIRVPKMRSLLRPKQPKAPVKGFQIFEKIKQKCLTFLSKAFKFRYETCDFFNLFQRFEWSTDGLPHIVIPETKYCLTTGSYKLKSLRVARCQANKRSQNWICMRNTLFNGFHKTYFLSFASEEESVVRLSKDPQRRGRFVIYGTAEDSLCSLRQTVNGVFRCSYSLDPSCGFKSTDNTQFQWIFRTPSWGDLKYFTMFLSSDTFFQVFRRVWRGSRTAVIRSPWFNGVRCIEFRSFLYGSSDDRLLFYKSDGGANELLLRIGAEKEKRWRFHRITVHASHCETYQVLFKAILPTSGNAKLGIHDIQVFPGPCESTAKQTVDGQCLKGWKFFNGSCFYAFNFTTTWHQALAVCQITGADLATDIAVSRLYQYHHRSAVWFGVRSCPNGQFYSTQAIRYRHKNTPVASQTCLQLQMATGKSPTHRTSSCDMKLPFACQKDPKKTENGCGLKNTSLANDRQWPWHVIIVMFRNCICSGTLISPGYVVTSTLCVAGVRMQDVKIFIPNSRTIVHKVTNIISHPKSGLKSGDKDIAILIFDHVVLSSPSIRFACLNKMTSGWKETKSSKNELLKDTKCVVLGWGTYSGGKFTCGPHRYKVREVEIVEKKECEEYYGKDKITEEMLCVSPRTRRYRICHGDTGGPLVCDIAGAWTLVGITTWGVDCTATRKYGIYTDVASVRPWIDYIITEQKNKETLQ